MNIYSRFGFLSVSCYYYYNYIIIMDNAARKYVKCETFFFTARSQRMRYETRGLETTPTVYRLCVCVTPRVSKVSQYIVDIDIKLYSRVTAHMTPRRIHPSYLLIIHAHYK